MFVALAMRDWPSQQGKQKIHETCLKIKNIIVIITQVLHKKHYCVAFPFPYCDAIDEATLINEYIIQ
jgi:hypothetical protein